MPGAFAAAREFFAAPTVGCVTLCPWWADRASTADGAAMAGVALRAAEASALVAKANVAASAERRDGARMRLSQLSSRGEDGQCSHSRGGRQVKGSLFG